MTGADRTHLARAARRLALLLATAILGPAGFARSAGAAPYTGDLLVIAGGVVQRVNPSTGAVSDFSPRAGSGTNLLTNPTDIASDPEGEVFVVDAGRLLQIDAATGAQHEVRAYNPNLQQDFPLDLGTSPWGVGVSPIAPVGLNGRSIFVGSLGVLYEVTRDAFIGTSSAVFASFPTGWESYEGQSVSIDDIGGGNVSAWVGTYGGVLAGVAGSFAARFTESTGTILGTREVGGVDYISRTFGVYCTDFPTDNGLWKVYYDNFVSTYSIGGFSKGGDLFCPGPIAAALDATFPLHVADRGHVPNRIVKVTQNGDTSIVGSMPGSQVIESLTVYAPEPGAVASGLAACTIVAAHARRRTTSRSRAKRVR